MKPTPAIGILGGTYDPVHLGHVYIAETLAQSDAFQQIRIVPCYQPVHRHSPTADPETRLKMVRLAFNHAQNIQVDDTEIQRQGPSYAYDTLAALKGMFPDQPICWILGSDAFAAFHRWHAWESFLNIGHLVVVKRPGSPLPETGPVHTLLETAATERLQDLMTAFHGKIAITSLQPPPISARNIREKLQRQESVEAFLPADVWQYIHESGCYR